MGKGTDRKQRKRRKATPTELAAKKRLRETKAADKAKAAAASRAAAKQTALQGFVKSLGGSVSGAGGAASGASELSEMMDPSLIMQPILMAS